MQSTFMLNNRIEEWKPDLTIQNVLEQKDFIFKLLVVKIDGKLVKRSDYATAIIPREADVQILHLMSGG